VNNGAPGGVYQDNALWLKADDGISDNSGNASDNWIDQSSNGLTSTFVDFDGTSPAVTTPEFLTGTQGLNFNPIVDWPETGAAIDLQFDGANGSSLDNRTTYLVFRDQGLPNQTIFSSYDSGERPDGTTGAAYDWFVNGTNYADTSLNDVAYRNASITENGLLSTNPANATPRPTSFVISKVETDASSVPIYGFARGKHLNTVLL